MAYQAGIAQRHAVGDEATTCNGGARDTRPTMIAVARIAADRGVGEAGVEAAYPVTAPRMRHSMEGMKASPTKTTNGMKAAAMEATATMETAATATMETAATAMETTAPTMETTTAVTAPTTACVGDVRAYQTHDGAREDTDKGQPSSFTVSSSRHGFLHLN